MNDAELLLEWFVVGFAWILRLNILVLGVLLLVDTLRNPPGWWIRWRIPDHVPPDWSSPERKVKR